MHLPFKVLILFAATTISACCTHEIEWPMEETYLPDTWIHEHEAYSHSSQMKFIPEGSKELGRPDLRNRLELKPDGRATYLVETLTDEHKGKGDFYMKGKWTFDKGAKSLLLINKHGDVAYAFMVHEISEGNLRLSYLDTGNYTPVIDLESQDQ